MQVTMYIYSKLLPDKELTLYRCNKCTRPMFKANSDKIMISNAYGSSYQDLPPSSHYIEYQCHSCKAIYAILFQ